MLSEADDQMQMQAEIGDILFSVYVHGRKPGTLYLDSEPDTEFQNRVPTRTSFAYRPLSNQIKSNLIN